MPEQNGGTSGNETRNAVGGSEGITVAQAAASLGVSARAIRARLQRGTLDGYQIPGPRGEEWRVLGVPAPSGGYTPEPGSGIPKHTGTGGASWGAERSALMAEVEWLRGRVETYEGMNRDLGRLLAQAQQQNAALSSRLESLAARAGGSDTTERDTEQEPASSSTGREHHGREQGQDAGAEQQQRRRRWWKFWGQGV